MPMDSTTSCCSTEAVGVAVLFVNQMSQTSPVVVRVQRPTCAPYTKSSASNRTTSHGVRLMLAPTFAIPPTNVVGPTYQVGYAMPLDQRGPLPSPRGALPGR